MCSVPPARSPAEIAHRSALQEGHVYRSQLSGFHRLDVASRVERLCTVSGLSDEDASALSPEHGLRMDQADHMVENVVGVFGLPLGVCSNLCIDGEDRIVPMAIEEASVVAAASHAAKLLRTGGSLVTRVSPSHMIGQIQLLDVSDGERLRERIMRHRDRLLEIANAEHPRLRQVGGGAIDIELHSLPPRGEDDPVGPMWIVHLVVDVCDAMGANTINSMCERLAPDIADLTGARVGLRILSNLADRRTITVTGRVPFASLADGGLEAGEKLARAIEEASVFAERDPYRAATHNKGIMNGVDAVLIALGQDWRAVEAGAHAFAARTGHYGALACWRVRDGALEGRLEMPMAVGTVGGVVHVHPAVRVLRRVARVENAADLARVAASVGLAQNLGALRALAGEGIQRGHMRLHARNIAVQAGAVGRQVEEVAARISEDGTVNFAAAKAAVARRALADEAARADLGRFRDVHLARITALVDSVAHTAFPEGSPLHETLRYHMETGGKRLRAMAPLAVAHALGTDPTRIEPFAAACEVLHNATLVHDDVQDGDETRRGRPTVWAEFGRARAIDLGDAMFYLAVLLVQQTSLPAARRESLTQRLIRDTLRVLDGQEQEILLRDCDAPSAEAYIAMVEAKTSGLFSLPLAGAAEACGADAVLIRELEEAARHMGVLFQVQDDVLDLYGDKGRERRGSDIAEGKRSALVTHALRAATASDRADLLTILDAPRDATGDDDIARAIRILERTNAPTFAAQLIQQRRERALALPRIAAHRPLHELVREMCDVFVEPIRPLLAAQRRAS